MSDDDNKKKKGDPQDENDDEVEVDVEELTEEDRALVGASLNEGESDEDEDATAGSTSATASDDTVVGETLVTREGLKKLKDELENLESVRRREVASRLKEAIAYGDLSENSEYQEAKEEQAFMEGRIAELHQMVKHVKIIGESSGKKGKVVKIGSTVTVQNLTEKDEPETYTIVGSTEADPRADKISNESPIGMAILDQEEGDDVTVKSPSGIAKYRIVKVKG
jgi:transcription elongation factor GreA